MCKSVSCLNYSKHHILGETHRMGPFKDHQEQKQCIMRWNIPDMNLDGTIFVKCSHTPSQQNLSTKETTTKLNGNVKPNYFWENVEWSECRAAVAQCREWMSWVILSPASDWLIWYLDNWYRSCVIDILFETWWLCCMRIVRQNVVMTRCLCDDMRTCWLWCGLTSSSAAGVGLVAGALWAPWCHPTSTKMGSGQRPQCQ